MNRKALASATRSCWAGLPGLAALLVCQFVLPLAHIGHLSATSQPDHAACLSARDAAQPWLSRKAAHDPEDCPICKSWLHAQSSQWAPPACVANPVDAIGYAGPVAKAPLQRLLRIYLNIFPARGPPAVL